MFLQVSCPHPSAAIRGFLFNMPGLDDLSDLSSALASVHPETTLSKYIQEQLGPSLSRTQHAEKLVLKPKTLRRWQSFLQKWKLPAPYLENQIERCKGMKYLPALVLRNPPDIEWQPYDRLETSAPTILWLNQVLEPLGLNLRDICTINLFPFITEEWLLSLSEEDQQTAVRESLDLTVDFFKTYQLDTVISCQCVGQNAPQWLAAVVDHPLLRILTSTVSNALSRKVKRVQFADQMISVIQAFHPSYILRTPNVRYKADRQRILSSLLTEIYAYCRKWKISTDIEHTVLSLQKQTLSMRNTISRYQDLEQQLYQLSHSTCHFTYTSPTETGMKTEFPMHTWSKNIEGFLSTLPSSSITLNRGEELFLSSIFPIRVRISHRIYFSLQATGAKKWAVMIAFVTRRFVAGCCFIPSALASIRQRQARGLRFLRIRHSI
jgi:hypothetical protein